MSEMLAAARVSVGMPVYNGGQYLRSALESALSQSFRDIELIISDNASTDNTESICREYAAKDARIKYVRQSVNIGPYANFKFVLDEAKGEYFIWAACDDVRSNNFIEVNLNFLKEHPDYVASTSPNGFEGIELAKQTWVNFKLDGDRFERITEFFKYSWVSHGIFYSLIRADVLRSCPLLGQSFIAADWGIDLYLASYGKINRTTAGYTIFGIKGVSSSADAYKAFRNHWIERFVPFYRLSQYVYSLSKDFNQFEKSHLVFIMAKLNIKAHADQVWACVYPVYVRYVRPIVRKKLMLK